MSIEWISVRERVPNDRRPVLVWGTYTFLGYDRTGGKGEYLGRSRYNWSSDGGQFDIERASRGGWSHITHWAEITPPPMPPRAEQLP